MSDDLLKHLYGFSSGMYFTVVIMLVLFGISYWRQHHWKVATAFLLVASAFSCFALYNIFMQQTFSEITHSLYSPSFIKLCGMLAPVPILILTYIYIQGFSMRSSEAHQLIEEGKWVVYFIYGSTIINIITLYFVNDIQLMSKLILLGFLIPCIGAAAVAFQPKGSSTAGKGYGFLFTGLAITILTLGMYYLEHSDKLSPIFLVMMNLLFGLLVICVSFLSIRYGYMEVRSFFRLQALDNRKIMGDITKGLINNEFRLHYQPQYDLSEDKITAVEALIRWHHPEKGLIPPPDYIPLAEESGLINNITQWVISTAIAEGKQLFDNGTPLSISLNFSPNDITPSIIKHLEKTLKAHDYPSDLLVVEITESLVIKSEDADFNKAMNQLHGLGVSVSIDDYGTGFSSLSHMQKLDVHELKIDQSFIKDLKPDTDNYAIVYSTVQMARHLHLISVAEGVEDKATLALLKDMDCDMAQGYSIAKPMPLSELFDWLKHSSN